MSSSPAADAAAARRAKILAKSAERMSLVKGELAQPFEAAPSTSTITSITKAEVVTKNEIQQPVVDKSTSPSNPVIVEKETKVKDASESSPVVEKKVEPSPIVETKKVEKSDVTDVSTDGLRRRGHVGTSVVHSDERASTTTAPAVVSKSATESTEKANNSKVTTTGSGGVGVLSEAARVLRRQQQIDSMEAVLLAGFPVVLGFACATAWSSCGLISKHSYLLSSEGIASEGDARLVATRKLFGAESNLMTSLDEGQFLDDEGGADTTSLSSLSSATALNNPDSVLLLFCSHISKRAPLNAPLGLIAVCLGRFIITSILSFLKTLIATATNSKAKDVLSKVQAEQNGASQSSGMLGMLAGALKYGNVAMKWYRYGKSVVVDVSVLVVSWIIVASILSLTQ